MAEDKNWTDTQTRGTLKPQLWKTASLRYTGRKQTCHPCVYRANRNISQSSSQDRKKTEKEAKAPNKLLYNKRISYKY